VPPNGRRPGVVYLTTIAPFLAFFWLIAAFALHVSISNKVAHHDCGFGLSPDPWVTLPNGYKLGSLNTYDGFIAAPGVETAQPVFGVQQRLLARARCIVERAETIDFPLPGRDRDNFWLGSLDRQTI